MAPHVSHETTATGAGSPPDFDLRQLRSSSRQSGQRLGSLSRPLRAKNCCSASVKTNALPQLQHVRFLSVSIPSGSQSEVTSFLQIYTDKIPFLSPSWGIVVRKVALNGRFRNCLILCTSKGRRHVVQKTFRGGATAGHEDTTVRHRLFRRVSPRAEPELLAR